ncbi:MAG: hypothetical protein IJ083_01575, partial [Clostridia bacterium]|nr:hypothetical protein [Clostridia bacterium]
TWKVGAETVTWPAGTTITVKVIQQAGETETGSALFTVSGSEAVTESITPDSTVSLSNITAKRSGTNDNVTTYTLNNLPAKGIVDEQEVEYTYTIEETAVTKDGENLLNKTWKMTANGDAITNEALGSLKITKVVQYNGEADATAKEKEFFFGIYEDESHTKLVQEVKVTVGYSDNTKDEAHTLTSDGTGWMVVDDLPYGNYYIYELIGTGGDVITDGKLTLDENMYTVTGAANPIVVSATQAIAKVTNNLEEKGSIKVLKEVKFNGTQDTTNTDMFYVMLYKVTTEGESADAHEVETAVSEKQDVVANSIDGYTFENLDIGSTYRVYEVDSDGAKVGSSFGEYTVSYDEQTKTLTRDAKTATVTVTNNKSTTTLSILKVDANGMTKPLPGAEFTLKKLNEEGKGDYTTGSAALEVTSDPTNAEGQTSFTDLADGYYEVKETKLPDGYVLTDSGTFYIKVQNGEITHIAKDTSTVVTEWVAKDDTAKLTFNATTKTATIGNESGVALPSSGGPGTKLFYILGSILVCLAGIMLCRRKRVV